MARKAEPGISFYQLKCNHIHNAKVRLLINDEGADGYLIWQFMLAEGYQKNGYFYDPTDADELQLFASDVCKKEIQQVRRVIDSCLRRKLFDKDIYDQYNILTCDHMQKVYLLATAERRRKGTLIELVKEYLLIIPEDTRNISILPRNNGIPPVKKEILPRKKAAPSKNTAVQPTEDELKAKELKEAYDNLPKDKTSIYHFINEHRPPFIEPYIAIWNIWATEYGKPKINTITDKRRRHLKARLSEKEFNILALLAKAKASEICRAGSWFNFDFLIKNSDGYIKLLEGNYDNKQQASPATTAAGSVADENFKKLLQPNGQK